MNNQFDGIDPVFCLKCRKQLGRHDEFCRHCGASTKPEAKPQPPPPPAAVLRNPADMPPVPPHLTAQPPQSQFQPRIPTGTGEAIGGIASGAGLIIGGLLKGIATLASGGIIAIAILILGAIVFGGGILFVAALLFGGCVLRMI